MLETIAGFLQIDPWPPQPGVVFWGALALVAGALLGEAARRWFGVPRIVGCSAVGLAIGLAGYGGGMLAGPARLVVDLALALLLFELGSRVRLRWLQANPALLATSALEAFASLAMIYLVLRWAGQPVHVALACATLCTSASGAVIARVAGELKSAGQVTERMIVLTALNTLLAVLAHRLVIGWLHLDGAGDSVRAVSQTLWTFGGSVLVAALLSRLVAVLARRMDLRDENAALLLLGMIVLALMVAQLANLSTLLVPLLAGVLLRNSTERPWVWPRHFGTAGGVLVLMLFVVVGSVVTLPAVLAGGALALLLLAARGLTKTAAVFALARWSGIGWRQAAGLSLALTPLSGTALVLLTDLQLEHPEFAPSVVPIVLSAIAVMELFGPLAVQWGLRLAGEHRPEPNARAAEGVTA